MSKTPHIVCYGEILWDIFPNKRRLGGAPLNVALRLQALGAKTTMISAIGKDNYSKETLSILDAKDFATSHIQRVNRPTGKVRVTLSNTGNASYDILPDVAWDHIQATPEAVEEVQQAGAFIFGSLALREAYNQEQFEQLVAAATYTVFDLNLRDPHYDIDVAVALMDIADCIKLNDEELELIVAILGLQKETLEEELKAVAQITNTTTICVTLGADGAMLLHKEKIYTQVGYPTKVVDTVGAGDSFLAGLVYGLLTGQPPQKALQLGCVLGSLIAGKAGANAVVTQEEIDNLLVGS